MSSLADDREAQLEERERAISQARAALRSEREQASADRVEAARLLNEARTAQREATRTRDRAKQLAGRFVRRAKHNLDATTFELAEQSGTLEAERQRLAKEKAHFEAIRSEYHATAAAARDRLHETWVALRARQKRIAKEWILANRHFTEENKALAAQAADLTRRERALADNRARLEADAAGFREEASSLEARIANARQSLTELESRRDKVRTEMLSADLPAELSIVASTEIAVSKRAGKEPTSGAIGLSLEGEANDLDDRQRMVAEQLTSLAAARVQWQRAEQETVIEMERFARELGQRERMLDVREQWLIRADGRRRDEAYEQWQLRLRLEAWQTKLQAYELRFETERQITERDLEHRLAVLARREVEIESAFSNWEKARTGDRERLRSELELWADDRRRMTAAIADFDRQREELLGELSRCAARAVAAEELMASAAVGSAKARTQRRFRIVCKRWQAIFERKAKEVVRRREELVAERAGVDERYRELQNLLLEAIQRESVASNRDGTTFLAASLPEKAQSEIAPSSSSQPSRELEALRSEVERLASVLLEIELPEPPDPSIEDVPWAAEDSASAAGSDVIAFDSGARAA